MKKLIASLLFIASLNAHAFLTPIGGGGGGGGAVDSVNGQTGVVTLTTDEIPEATNLYFLDSRAKNACVADSITNGITDVAPSQNAVFDALGLKQPVAFTASTPGDWSPAPTTIQIALDQLAARPVSGVTFPITAPLGSAGAPSFRFDSDTGMYSLGDGQLAFSANNVQRLLIEPAGATFSGTVTATNFIYPTQTANTFLAGPTTGSPAVPSFRAIGAGDVPNAAIPWPLDAPAGSASAPSYRFDSDTGMYSPTDGDLRFSANLVDVLQLISGNGHFFNDLNVDGNLTAANFPGAAVWGQITGTLSTQTDLQSALNAKEDAFSVLPVSKGGTNTNAFGAWQLVTSNSAGDTLESTFQINHDYGSKGLNAVTTVTVPAAGAADNTGYRLHAFETELNPADVSSNFDVYSFTNDCHIDRTHSGFAFGGQFVCKSSSLSAEGDGHNKSLILNNENVNLSGNLGGGITDQVYLSPQGLNISSGYTVDFLAAQSRLVQVQPGGALTQLNMLNNGFNGDVSSNVNYDIGDMNGNVGGNYTGIRRALTGNVIGNVQMSQLSHVGNGNSFQGLNILANGTYTNGGQILNLDASNMINGDGTPPVAMNINSGRIQTNGNAHIPNGLLGQSYHSLQVGLDVTSGSPIANTFMSAYGLTSSWAFHDDMGSDGLGFKLGAIAEGGFGQFSIDPGKTVDAFNGKFLAWIVPPGSSGTLNDASMFRVEGFINQGGTLAVGNLKGFHAGQLLCGMATNCWSFYDEANGENYLSKLAIGTTTKKVVNSDYSLNVGDDSNDLLAGFGDTNLISGDLRSKIRVGYKATDPSTGVAANRLGVLSTLDVEFTDNNSTALINDYHLAKVKIAAGKAMSSPVANHFSAIGRTDAADDGDTPYLVNNVSSLTWGNSTARTAGLYASYLAGFHSVDNQGTISNWYDFYAMADSAGAGVVTNRYGIVIEPAANYTKKNWLSGFTQIGDSTLSAPTHALEVRGDLTVSDAIKDGSDNQAIDVNNRELLDSSGAASIAWNSRLLKNSDGDTVADFSDTDQRMDLHGHLKLVQVTIPVATVDANAGTGATCTATGSDQSFKLELITGSAAWAANSQCSVAFDKVFDVAPRCVFSPANANAAAAAMNAFMPDASTSAQTIEFTNADVAATTYQWNVHCI